MQRWEDMKNKHPKEQNKIRFKILDVVIILLIVASVVGIYFRYRYRKIMF